MTRMTTRLPQRLADALATRAEANHRSVNGELCAILEAALSGTPVGQAANLHDKILTIALGQIIENTGDSWAADVALEAATKYKSLTR